MRRSPNADRVIVPLMLVLAAGQAMPLRAQEPAATAPVPAAVAPATDAGTVPIDAAPSAPVLVPAQEAATQAPAPAAPDPAAQPPTPIAFNFKNTPWEMVVDFIARQTGLPVIQEATPPAAPVTFISGAEYSVDEALDIVNRMLWMHGMQLRREGNYLLLSKLEDVKARSKQFMGQVPDSVGAAEIITLVLPLNNATAASMAEKLQPLVTKGVGALTALPQQNALIIVDTAAQARRVREIIGSLDSKPAADSEFKLFPLKHAEAQTVFQALRGLVAEKQTTVVIDKDGSRRVVQEENFQGISIQPDARTNSIIAVGPSARIRTVEEVVTLLDAEGEGGRRELTTFALAGAAADEAAAKVTQLFAQDPPRSRPTVLPLPQQGKLSVVGSAEQVRRVGALLAELDPGSAQTGAAEAITRSETIATVTPLKFVRAEAAQIVLQRLLSPRLTAVLRYAPAPDGKGMIVSGPSPDVKLFEQLLAAVDIEPKADREVRQVRVSGNAAEVADKAVKLYALTGKAEIEPVMTVIDPDSRTVTLVGSRAAIATVSDLIRTSQDPVSTNVRVFTLTGARADAASNILRPVLMGRARELQQQGAIPAGSDAGAMVEMTADSVSNILIVTAPEEVLKVAAELVQALDAATLASNQQMRMIPIDRSRADAKMIAEQLQRMLQQQGTMKVEVITAEELLKRTGNEKKGSFLGPKSEPARFAAPDRRTDVVAADSPAVLNERTRPSGLAALQQVFVLLAIGAIDDPPAAAEPAPVTIAVDPTTNSLIILGGARAIDQVAALAADLQRQMPAEPTNVKIVKLADAVNPHSLSALLNSIMGQIGQASPGNPGGFTGRVLVQPDPEATSLIVTANETDFATIAELITTLSRPGAATKLSVKVYPLQNVPAAGALQAIRDLFRSRPEGVQARRVRSVELAIPGPDGKPGEPIAIDPATVSLTADPSGSAVIIAAPAEAIALVDRFIALLDQSPQTDRVAMRVFEIRNAKAADTARTLQSAMDAMRQATPGAAQTPAARYLGDDRTNSILVTATEAQFKQTERLIVELDKPLAEDGTQVSIIPLQIARPSTVQRIVEAVIAGRDPARRDKFSISATDDASLFVFRGTAEHTEEVRRIVAEVDRSETAGGLPVRSIKLERADAQTVAAGLRQFFDQRAQASNRPGQGRRQSVSIVGDRRSATLVVAATDDDFATIESLVSKFDAPAAARDLKFLAVGLQHTKVGEIRQTIEQLLNQLRWTTLTTMQARGGDGPPADLLVFDFDERTNSVVMIGQGDNFEQAERIIRSLDVPAASGMQVTLRAVRIEHADPRVVAQAIQGAMNKQGRPWQSADVEGVRVEVDQKTRTLVLVGRAERIETAMGYVRQLDLDVGADREMATLPLKFAAADRVALSLQRFFQGRAAPGSPEAGPTLIGSRDGNVLIASGSKDDLEIVRKLLADMDQADEGEGRTRELFTLKNSDAAEIANTLREQFPRTLAQRDGLVIVTPQASTNSLLVSAPAELFARVSELINQLDLPPTAEAVRIVTVTLSSARADDVAASLTAAMPRGVKVKVTPVRRTNSILLTGSDEAIKLVSEQIARLDSQPTRAQEFIRLKLQHAVAGDVALTLRQVMNRRQYGPGETQPAVSSSVQDNTLLISAAPDQIDEIRRIISQVDIASEVKRTTEFVPLKYADAEQTARALELFYGRYAPEAATPAARNVTIIANPISKSLVVSADEAEWKGIRAIIEKLDSEEYDTSRRLEIVALRHADAAALARALTESFAAPLRAELERERIRRQERRARGWGDDFGFDPSTVLLDAKDTVTITAEPLTNSLILGAARDQVDRIKAVIAQLDVPDSARLPEARIIPLRMGPATQIALALRQTFTDATPTGVTRPQGPRSVVIIGEDKSNSLIIRAEESQFAQIKAMAETLQQEGDRSRAKVRVLPLKNVSAFRVATAVRTTFANVAREGGETLAIEVDRTGNALVVASSEKIFEQVRQVAQELDALQAGDKPGGVEAVPGLGQTVQIVDIEHNSPADIIRLLDQLGVTRPQAADRQGVVSEQVTVTALASRRALAVVGSQADIISVAALIKSLDAAPAFGDQQLAIVRLKTGQAAQVVTAIQGMLITAAADAASPPAKALLEQIRRLNIQREDGNGQAAPPLAVDLGKPIHVFAETQTNSVIVSSTKENVAAVKDLVVMLDRLPIGDAITVRLYPLQIASAQRVSTVIRELFAQADRLRTLPGTQVRGEPTTASGKSLMSPIAVTVDDRTNTLIVAAQEDAVALVEVLVKQLDSDKGAGWVEPTVIQLKHADARRMAVTLQQVFVQGLRETPEAQALQRAVGRISILQAGKDPADPNARIESDLFAGLSSIVISAQDQLNALVVVGSTSNVAVMKELIKMLDVPAASAANTVRVYPLQFAAADRVAAMLREIFRQQVQTGALRPEDDAAITSDVRTNSLVISSSGRSFAIVEGLLQKLDGDAANPMVGLHVIPVTSGNAAALAPRILQLMRERIDSAARAGGLTSARDTFSIQAEPSTNSLIVAASDENLAVVKQLVELLGKGADTLAGSQVLDVIAVKSAKVEQMAAALRELYVEKVNRDRGVDTVRVTPDTRLNALIVSGTAADLEAIRTLVKRLDTAQVTAVTEIKRIELKKTDAIEVVRLLQNVLAGRSLAGGGAVGQRQALVVRFLREQKEGELGRSPTEAEISGAIQEQVTLTPEPRTNSIVVNAPAQLMVLIESLVNDIDTSAAGARSIEVFELVNADARAMATVLRELFSLREQGNTLVLVPERQPSGGTVAPGGETAGPPAPSDQSSQFFSTLDERQQLSITIDARTNSLIVSATKEYLEEVRKVVEKLDGKEVNERENYTIRLRNAKAPEAATTLKGYFKEESDRVRQLLGPDRVGSLVSQLEREVIVQGDDKSNSLLVSVSPRYKEKVAQIIDEIDATPPQVLIQVLLAEVTLDNSGQWGLEARVGPFGGDMVGGRFLGAGAPISTALGVPNFSVSSIDFDLLVRALEAQGRLEVLSRPQLTVRDNEKAHFQVGQNIGLADSIQTYSNGNTQTNVRREDVGIILDVTPSVSDDGYIRMDVQPTISSLSDRVTQINEQVQSSIIDKRDVKTVVTVKDGETIVLGGLIQNREQDTKTKVPFLGDIPIVGELFKSSKYTNTKTELLVLLTPRIIRSSQRGSLEQMRQFREQEINNLSKTDTLRRWLPPELPPEELPPAEPLSPEAPRPQPAGPPSGPEGVEP